MQFQIKDINLASQGKKLIDWASQQMPVLQLISRRFLRQQPLKKVVVGACLHITSETANLAITLKQGGADVYLCASNPLSTNDAVAAALVDYFNIPVFAVKGEDTNTYYRHLNAVLDYKPNYTMDDGADLVSLLHRERKSQISEVACSNEETTTGVIRLRAMERDKALKIPVIAVNDNLTKHLFDNRYGTGQSTIDGILRATNILLAGKSFVVCGYGWCGRGLAMRARGMGAKVTICEVDPIKALEAHLDGYLVMPLQQAIKTADIVVTTTGNKQVVDKQHFLSAQDGVILANSGHFDVEVNLTALKKIAKKVTRIRPMVDEYQVPVKKNQQQKLVTKKIYVLAEGRLVNLSAADGHPASVMDMSFAGQALACEWGWHNRRQLKAKVYRLPEEIDAQIAKLKLETEKITIDSLTSEQKKYMRSWQEGT